MDDVSNFDPITSQRPNVFAYSPLSFLGRASPGKTRHLWWGHHGSTLLNEGSELSA